MLTPVGVLGGIRGVLFANMGGGSFGETTDPANPGKPFKWASTKEEVYTPILGYEQISLLEQNPVYGPSRRGQGLRLIDARASYGIGLETFALGFPVHFDWSWKTLLNKDWEDLRFAAFGGSSTFRKPKFSVLDRLRLLNPTYPPCGPDLLFSHIHSISSPSGISCLRTVTVHGLV